MLIFFVRLVLQDQSVISFSTADCWQFNSFSILRIFHDSLLNNKHVDFETSGAIFQVQKGGLLNIFLKFWKYVAPVRLRIRCGQLRKASKIPFFSEAS